MTKKVAFSIFAIAVFLGSSVAEGGAATGNLDITMGKDGPVFGGKKIERETETEIGGVFLRAKKLKAGGMSLLVKSKGEKKEITVFGRSVKLGTNGQYQVKWDPEKRGISTAEVDAEAVKWVAPPNLYKWFSGSDGAVAAKEEVIRLPRKIVFKPGEGVPAPEVDSDDYLPPLRDVDGKLAENSGRGADGFDGGFYPPDYDGGRNGAEAEVVPIAKSVRGGDEEYVIQPGDTIDLNFYRVQRVTVDLKGDIRVVSSIGSAESVIRAAGKTPKEISESVMNSGLNFRSVSEPALKINVSRFSDKSVVVLGKVGKPGKIPVEDGEILTAAGAIKRAGGVAGNKNGAVVYIKRGDKISKAELDGEDQDALELFKIMPGDIITVNKP